MVWLKRSVMTFKFKGRPRRGLYWSKSVYKLWFEFAKERPKKNPPEFGDLTKFKNFEEWWRHPDYGFELFCEPEEESPLDVVDSVDDVKNKDVVYVKVNLNEQPQKLKKMFSTIIKKNQNPKPVLPKSHALFQPSLQEKNIKKEVLLRYLDNWKDRTKKSNKLSRREIFRKNNPDYNDPKIDEYQLRTISRDFQRAKEIFANIEKGTFP